MKVGNAEAWKNWQARNQDRNGRVVILFSDAWASLMEAKMAEGAKLEEVARTTLDEVDARYLLSHGMLGASFSVLATSWKFGEQLQGWYESGFQAEVEAEEVNASKLVLTPSALKDSYNL